MLEFNLFKIIMIQIFNKKEKVVPRKEFIHLMEENVLILDRLAAKLRLDPAYLSGYPRQQMIVLVRLHLGGRARLKDIAARDALSAPNLCCAFRKLEQDGFIARDVDAQDRRNVWYSVTQSGAELATRVMENFRSGIDRMFANISKADEERLTAAIKTMNSILKTME